MLYLKPTRKRKLNSDTKMSENKTLIEFCEAVQQASKSDTKTNWDLVYDYMCRGLFNKHNFEGMWSEYHDSLCGSGGCSIAERRLKQADGDFTKTDKKLLKGFTARKLQLITPP